MPEGFLQFSPVCAANVGQQKRLAFHISHSELWPLQEWVIGSDKERQWLFAKNFDVEPLVLESIVDNKPYIQLSPFKLWINSLVPLARKARSTSGKVERKT
jgi:hypothetical protein